MENRFKSLSIFEFQSKFPDELSCVNYLSDLKWGNGYICKKCSHTHYCKGNRVFDRQCTHCRYIESATSGTLFHDCKFSLLKAFYIIYYVSTNKNGISSTELSRKLELRQKTCWLFKQKVMKAMESSGKFPMEGKVDVDETYVGGQDDGIKGRKGGRKKIVVLGIEKQGKGVSRMYARVIDSASKENLKGFMQHHIKKEAIVRTDKWAGYKGMEKEFPNIIREKSEKKGKNFVELHRCIMMFKAWLRGAHHSVKYLQSYINEYTYRYNRHKMKEGIFENLMNRMIKNPPHTYKMIIT
ncbi:IS1595 family transposase [Pedobacter jamesrossensis]|uniref:IS1595 family transposase n=1 Tax=Pedobacter jamesrossensis TaxID=1908238 RepID=A0ABV8NIL3_9SPHI